MKYSKLAFIIIVLRTGLFYLALALLGLIFTLGNIYALFANKTQMTRLLAFWTRVMRRTFAVCIGVKVEYRGLHNIPKEACIIASKHQSAFEATVFFNQFIPTIAYALKEEIGRQFWYFNLMYRKYDGIKLNRKDGIKALIKLEQGAVQVLNAGRSFAIFPEGTRVRAGKELPFKKGVARIYSRANVPVVPVALNTGVCWPKDSHFYYPGKIIVEFLPPIPTGLSEDELLQRLETEINSASKRILAETPCNYYMKKRGLC